MTEELNTRRSFLKRAGTAATVLTGSVVAVAASSHNFDRGAGSNTSGGVVTGRSRKKEILYKKTGSWSLFYDVAK
jgi:hypothetical protein